MTNVSPGWYKDPADPTTQRYWDGEGWLGDPLPADATPPPGPPPVPPPAAEPTPPAEPTPAVEPTSPGPGESYRDAAVPGTPAPVWPPAPPTAAPGAPMSPTAPPVTVPGRGMPMPPPPGWPAGYPYPFPRDLRMPAPLIHGLPLAGAGARFAARLIDIGVVLLLNIVANGYFVYRYALEVWPVFRETQRQYLSGKVDTASLPEAPQQATFQFMIVLVALAVWFAYEVPALAGSGQTLGKRLLGVRVVRLESPQPLGFRRASRRWYPMALPAFMWFCCFGFVIQFLDNLFVVIDRPLRQAIHDKFALTVVVHDRGGATVPHEGGPS